MNVYIRVVELKSDTLLYKSTSPEYQLNRGFQTDESQPLVDREASERGRYASTRESSTSVSNALLLVSPK